MPTATTYIIDFSDGQNTQTPETGEVPRYEASTCPSPLAISTPFRLIVQGAAEFDIRWPYTQSLSGPVITTEEYSEHVDIGGSDVLSPAHPVNSITSMSAINPLVGLDGETPAVFVAAGGSLDGSVQLGNIKLTRALWGTARVNYKSYTRVWTCGVGLPQPGQYAFQVFYRANLIVDGMIVGHKDVTSMITFAVDGDFGTDAGRNDFCSDLIPPGG